MASTVQPKEHNMLLRGYKSPIFRRLAGIAFLVFSLSCTSNDSLKFAVSTDSTTSLNDVVIELPISPEQDCAYNISTGAQNLHYDCIDKDGDLVYDAILVQLNRVSNYPQELVVHPIDAKPITQAKTQAFLLASKNENFSLNEATFEMKTEAIIPVSATEKSGYAHMEGPVWETNKIGYRIYLDKRNRIDIFGKKVEALVLDTVQSDYHKIQNWGADILKVGNSLGLGGIAAYKDGEFQVIDNWSSRSFKVLSDSDISSSFELRWFDWEVFGRTLDVRLQVTIYADHSFTQQLISIDGDYNDLSFVTGIVKHDDTVIEVEEVIGEGLVALTNGYQSDQGHSLAMGISVPNRYKPEFIDDHKNTHLILMKPMDGSLEYAYSASWNDSITIDYEGFKAYNMDLVYRLNHPISVTPIK